jgi:hypothetical protein
MRHPVQEKGSAKVRYPFDSGRREAIMEVEILPTRVPQRG